MGSITPEGEKKDLIGKEIRDQLRVANALARIKIPRAELALVIIGDLSSQPLDIDTQEKIRRALEELEPNPERICIEQLGNNLAVIMQTRSTKAKAEIGRILQTVSPSLNLAAGVSLFYPTFDHGTYSRIIDRSNQALSVAKQKAITGDNIHFTPATRDR